MERLPPQVRKAHTGLELERGELEDRQKRIAHKEARVAGAAPGCSLSAWLITCSPFCSALLSAGRLGNVVST